MALTRAEIEDAAPWLIGGLAFGVFAYNYTQSQAHTSPQGPTGAPAASGGTQADPWGTQSGGGSSAGSSGDDWGSSSSGSSSERDHFGADNVPSSSRVNVSKQPPQGYVDQPLMAPMPSPPYAFPVQNGEITKGFGWTLDGSKWRTFATIEAPAGSKVVMPAAGVIQSVTQSGSGYKVLILLNTPGVNPHNWYLSIDGLAEVYAAARPGLQNGGVTVGAVGSNPIKVTMMNELSGWQVFDPGPWLGLRYQSGQMNGLGGAPWHLPPAFAGYWQRWEHVPGYGVVPVMYSAYSYGVRNWY